jgi:hypothetical protein
MDCNLHLQIRIQKLKYGGISCPFSRMGGECPFCLWLIANYLSPSIVCSGDKAASKSILVKSSTDHIHFYDRQDLVMNKKATFDQLTY